MEVWNSVWIDPALTAIGYLLAGGLGAVIYAARLARRTAAVANPAEAQSSTIKIASGNEAGLSATAPRTERRPRAAAAGQYVDLSSRRGTAAAEDNATATETREKPRGNHRDRPEIVRVAKEMLKAGTAPQIIRRTLPITEAELALLQYANTK